MTASLMAGKQKLVSAPPSSESPGEMSVCTNYTFLLNAISYFHSTNDYVNYSRNNGNDDNRNESNRSMVLYCDIGFHIRMMVIQIIIKK